MILSNGLPEARHRAAKVLVVSMVHWASTTRLCLALAEGGFDILVLAPEGHALHDCPRVGSLLLRRTRTAATRGVRAEIARWQPDIVIPADDIAADLVCAIHAGARRRRAAHVVRLIEESIGDHNAFAIAGAKSRFVALADSLGLLVPQTRPLPDAAALAQALDTLPCPLVLKLDDTFGGRGVRIVRSADEAAAAFRALRDETGWRSAAKRSLRGLDLHPIWALRHSRSITVQAYVEGRPANRAVLCRNGKVLAGLSVEALETSTATGPATVVRPVDHPAMSLAATRLVERLGLSGFVGFDFVLEAGTDRAFLLEMNLRPTQICHLALDAGSDMIGALAAALGTVPAARPLPNFPGGAVALFPQESWRNPDSPYLATAFHDVPWQAPEIVKAYRRPVADEPPHWLRKLQARHAPIAGAINPEAVDV
jgi:glutathione synthase/RimK-type ligase-like ATP-grasp enzyme